MKPEAIARVCHEANRALQIEQNDPTIPISPHWDEESDETRLSAVNGVLAVIHDDVTPEQSHVNWMNFKRAHGWTYGPVKDEQRKEHPLLVPYSDLPEHQRVKDALFGVIIRTLAEA